ncbi:MAG: hypothetical protein PWQ50_2092 [Methanolobus sp.]|nr:hypothetical protein [Methanolobus sp.]
MGKMIYFSDDEIEFFKELSFRIDQGGGMAWIEELVQKDKIDIYIHKKEKQMGKSPFQTLTVSVITV